MAQVPVWKPKFERGNYFSSMVVASRKSGKSYFVKWLLKEHLNGLFHLTVVMCPSVDDLQEYKGCIGKFPNRMMQHFDEEYLEKLLITNESRMLKGKKPIETLVLIDDSSGVDTRNSEMLFKLYSRGRHAGVSVIFICQEYSSLPPKIRNNVELFVVMRQLSSHGRLKVAEEVLSGSIRVEDGINEKKYFLDLQDEYAREVGDMLIVSKMGSDDGLFKFRAPSGVECVSAKLTDVIVENPDKSSSSSSSDEKEKSDGGDDSECIIL